MMINNHHRRRVSFCILILFVYTVQLATFGGLDIFPKNVLAFNKIMDNGICNFACSSSTADDWHVLSNENITWEWDVNNGPKTFSVFGESLNQTIVSTINFETRNGSPIPVDAQIPDNEDDRDTHPYGEIVVITNCLQLDVPATLKFTVTSIVDGEFVEFYSLKSCGSVDSCDGVTCTLQSQCHDVGTCLSGVCSNPIKINGTICDDSNFCTQTDTCQSGQCIGSNPVTCSTTDCIVSTCNTGTGTCDVVNESDGKACGTNKCNNTCSLGSCIPSPPVVCNAQSQCHTVGTCDQLTGICTNPNQVDDTDCDDSSQCTQLDTCQSGKCIGSNPITCAAAAAAAEVCKSNLCNPSTGQCTISNHAVGTICDDNDTSTSSDQCTAAGTCFGTPKTDTQPPSYSNFDFNPKIVGDDETVTCTITITDDASGFDFGIVSFDTNQYSIGSCRFDGDEDRTSGDSINGSYETTFTARFPDAEAVAFTSNATLIIFDISGKSTSDSLVDTLTVTEGSKMTKNDDESSSSCGTNYFNSHSILFLASFIISF